MTYNDWCVIITSLEFSLDRMRQYRYDEPSHRQASIEPLEQVLAKAREYRRAAKASA